MPQPLFFPRGGEDGDEMLYFVYLHTLQVYCFQWLSCLECKDLKIRNKIPKLSSKCIPISGAVHLFQSTTSCAALRTHVNTNASNSEALILQKIQKDHYLWLVLCNVHLIFSVVFGCDSSSQPWISVFPPEASLPFLLITSLFTTSHKAFVVQLFLLRAARLLQFVIFRIHLSSY